MKHRIQFLRRRREFISLLGATAAAWPLAARGQPPERMRRIGVLMHLAADDPEGQARIGAFLQGLQEWGWAVGRNVRIEYRWAAGDVTVAGCDRAQKPATRCRQGRVIAEAGEVQATTSRQITGPAQARK